MPTTKSTPFAVSKDEWDTKEDTVQEGYIACAVVLLKASEATSNSKKIKPVTLAIVKLSGISQSGSQ